MNTNYTMKQAVKEAFKRIWDYEGRSTRAAFWKFQLASALLLSIFFSLFLVILFNLTAVQYRQASHSISLLSCEANPSTALQSCEAIPINTLQSCEAIPINTLQSSEDVSDSFEADSSSSASGVSIVGFSLLAISTLIMLPLFIFLALINLSLTCRRIADSGKNPLLILLNLLPMGYIVIFVFCCLDSEPGTNQWGPSLKYPS